MYSTYKNSSYNFINIIINISIYILRRGRHSLQPNNAWPQSLRDGRGGLLGLMADSFMALCADVR